MRRAVAVDGGGVDLESGDTGSTTAGSSSSGAIALVAMMCSCLSDRRGNEPTSQRVPQSR
jgi:hypothetical protein